MNTIAPQTQNARYVREKSRRHARPRPFWSLVVLIAPIAFPSLSSLAQGTSFSVQGRLTDTGSPANGLYDVRVSLFSTSSGGTPIAGPSLILAVPVTNGLFSIAPDFGAGFFPGASRWLEMAAATNGSANFSVLTPRQAILAVPYAMTAGAIAGQGGVPSGGMLLSSNANDNNLTGAGYSKVGKVELSDSWEQRTAANAPAGREFHTAVWTGSEMIIWGGLGAVSNLNDGARYNPVLNTWTAISASGAPSARSGQAAVWTGTEMLVWGGHDDSYGPIGDGGRYNAAANTWASLNTASGTPPQARHSHTAIWTGTEMIIWGGYNLGPLGTGARYNPSANTWTAVATAGAPIAREWHTAIWTGTEMVVWGGFGPNNALNDGGRYNPATDTWTYIDATSYGPPTPRYSHQAVWTGTYMIVWGGAGGSTAGGRYLPLGGWLSATSAGAPTARQDFTAVWTGNEMLLWGGYGPTSCGQGERYDPVSDTWAPMTTSGGPLPRAEHTAVWTGSEMLIYGGGIYYGDLFSYKPPHFAYLYVRP